MIEVKNLDKNHEICPTTGKSKNIFFRRYVKLSANFSDWKNRPSPVGSIPGGAGETSECENRDFDTYRGSYKFRERSYKFLQNTY